MEKKKLAYLNFNDQVINFQPHRHIKSVIRFAKSRRVVIPMTHVDPYLQTVHFIPGTEAENRVLLVI